MPTAMAVTLDFLSVTAIFRAFENLRKTESA